MLHFIPVIVSCSDSVVLTDLTGTELAGAYLVNKVDGTWVSVIS